MRDLLFLVADKNMEYAIRGFFSRDGAHHRLGCSEIDFDPDQDILVAVGDNDPGLYTRADEYLRGLEYRHVVVMIDEEWEGSPGPDQIRSRLMGHIASAGWTEETGLPLVLVPEVDVWLWSDSPHAAKALGWDSWDELRAALRTVPSAEAPWLEEGAAKPSRPKEAAEWALRQKRKPRSSAVYKNVAARASINRCEDAPLQTLITRLQAWFPAGGA